MTAWAFLLTPVLVVPIVLLFRFVGCTPFTAVEGDGAVGTARSPPLTPDTSPPDYRKYILGEQPNPGLAKNSVTPNGSDVIAYWRLVDAAASTVADDEKNFRDGQYRMGHTLPAVNPTPTAPGSEGRSPAHFVTGQTGLITSDPTTRCRYFDGGYVFVPYKPGLYTDEFTIEAWIAADAFAAGYEHTLFDAGGRYSTPPGAAAADRGFRIFVNRDRGWQIDLGATKNLVAKPPLVPLGNRTHLAVTVANADAAGIKKALRLYVEGKLAVTANVDAYAPPHDAPLFIGLENTANAPAGALSLRHPVLCRIQEVVLHRKALSQAEIENHVDINR